jgi:hypothetical protein
MPLASLTASQRQIRFHCLGNGWLSGGNRRHVDERDVVSGLMYSRQMRRRLRSSSTGVSFALTPDAGNCNTVAIWPGVSRVTNTI